MAKNNNNNDNKESIDKVSLARKVLMTKGLEPEGLSIRGYDFDQGVDLGKVVDSFASTGASASHFSRAIEIVNTMRAKGAFVYLGFTSNMVTSGLRDIFRYLVKHKMVDVIVTTAGGIEEDLIKCLGDFKLGDFRAKGSELRDKEINRAGNIYIPNERYCKFEEFLLPILERYKDQTLSASQLIKILGEAINDENSFCYWSYKNNIPLFCPAITDGALGDMIYLFKHKHPQFKIDVTDDIVQMNNTTFDKDKIGVILLGSGVAKHHILNANMFRDGADYAVYINTAQEFDGSDAGALPEEAITWGKLMKNCEAVKVHGDATILFPLLVAKTFALDKENNKSQE